MPHQISLPREQGDFHLIPVAAGSGGRTGKIIFSVIIGGALLATGIGGAVAAASGGFAGMSSVAAGFAASSGVLGLSYGTLALMGTAFLLGGINMLLTPTPKEVDNKPTAFTFGGPAGISDEGGPVPLVYGEVIWAGVAVASSIRNGSAPFGGGWGGGGAGGGGGYNETNQNVGLLVGGGVDQHDISIRSH
jgi:predicted phage tail protein